MHTDPRTLSNDLFVHQDALISAIRVCDARGIQDILDQHPDAMKPLAQRTPMGALFMDYPHQMGRQRPKGWHDCLKILMAHGGDPTASHKGGSSVIYHLLKATGNPYGQAQAFSELAELYRLGVNPNAQISIPSDRLNTALNVAFSSLTWEGCSDRPVEQAVRLLLGAGARPSVNEPFSQIRASLVGFTPGGRPPSILEPAVLAIMQHPDHRKGLAGMSEEGLMLRVSAYVRGRWPRVMALLLADLEDLGAEGTTSEAAQRLLFRGTDPADAENRAFMNQCFLEYRTPRAMAHCIPLNSSPRARM